jgi:hypothetical protein
LLIKFLIVTRIVSLLRSGAIMGTNFEIYEAHIPYLLQVPPKKKKKKKEKTTKLIFALGFRGLQLGRNVFYTFIAIEV